MQTWVQTLGWEDPPEKGMATHSSILAWEIPQIKEPGVLQSMGSQRVGQDWVTTLCFQHSVWNTSSLDLGDFTMVTTVAEGRGLLHVLLCSVEELLHSGSLAPLLSFFLIHRLVFQGQKPQPSVPLGHLLLGSELQVSAPSTRRQPSREVPPVSRVVLGLPQAPSPPPLLHPGVGTQRNVKEKAYC